MPGGWSIQSEALWEATGQTFAGTIKGDILRTTQLINGFVLNREANKRKNSAMKEDSIDETYRQMQAATGQDNGAAFTPLLAALAFIIAALLVAAAFAEGVDSRQLLIAGIVLVCVNVIAAVVLAARHTIT
jgi:hypothetical protein